MSQDGKPLIHLIYLSHLRPTSQTNILIDKDGTTHLTGLGNARILPDSPAVDDGMGTDRTHAPELATLGMSLGETHTMHTTKASDMYAFGVMAFEVWRDFFEQHFPASLTHNRFLLDAPHFSS